MPQNIGIIKLLAEGKKRKERRETIIKAIKLKKISSTENPEKLFTMENFKKYPLWEIQKNIHFGKIPENIRDEYFLEFSPKTLNIGSSRIVIREGYAYLDMLILHIRIICEHV
ncbi:hypothetical protein LOAG_13916 [Loa loa]|uniref:Uncharacterized protein n=1 Tax=Loa loa TaxID=7209 RepID=A0A1S0TJ35_LOALO|nr:hypothetical protein LOAG_13916 [Loa loa]EFO14602.1 hypothetical protein LOAG_13916 [Loa loa]